MEVSVTVSAPLSILRTLKAYFRVTKLRTVWLLVLTGAVGFAIASQGSFATIPFLLLLFALTLGCAGANVLTCYVDRDIDAIMERTKRRPLPSSEITPGRALLFGAILLAVSLILSLFINFLVFILACLGIVSNVLVYSMWLKRKTPFNIFGGSIAGGIPVIAGYAAYANTIDLKSLLLGALVMLWIPIHVWSLALKYKEDYLRAKVPMLPVVVNDKRTGRFIALFSGLLVGVSLLPNVLGFFGPIYFWSAVVLGIALSLLTLRLTFNPRKTSAWVVFKMSSLYLGLLFLSLMVDSSLSV